jgi:hypothetical protein
MAASLMLAGAVAGGMAAPSGPGNVLEVHGDEATKTSPAGRDVNSNPSRTGERNAIAKALLGSYGNWRKRRFPNGPGWTHAHVGRMARKRRNQKRNKRAHRG